MAFNALTYTNAPAGGLEVTATGGTRVQVDLRTAVNVVFQVNFSVVPAAAGTCILQYSTNGGGAWAEMATLSGPWSANALKIGSPVAVPAPAKIATCLLRVFVTGDGAADPVLQRAQAVFQPA